MLGKLEKVFNQDRPSILNYITVTHLSFGKDFLRIESDMVSSESESLVLDTRFNVGWRGNASISISSSIALPFDKVLPFSATIRFTRIQGRGALLVPRGPNPLCALGFVEEPLVELQVDTEMGGLGNLANLPKVGSFIEKKAAEALVEELLLNRGGGFVIKFVVARVVAFLFHSRSSLPVPYVRKGLFVTASKRRAMLRRGDDLEAKLKTPKKQKPAPANRSSREIPVAKKDEEIPRKKDDVVAAAPKKKDDVVAAAPKKKEEDTFGFRFSKFTEDASKGIFALFDTNEEKERQLEKQSEKQPEKQSSVSLPLVPPRKGSSYVLSEQKQQEENADEDNAEEVDESEVFQNDASVRKRDKLRKMASDLLKK